MLEKEIVYKKHALDMMTDRGITKKQIEAALERGSKFKQTDNLWIKKNVNGVWYSELSGLMGYGFFSNDFRVIITLVSGGVEEKGFSNLVALNKIIDSFKFNQ